MDSLTIFIKPFENMNQCCIALDIIYKFKSIIYCVDIISKFFKKEFSVDDIDKFYKRAQSFPKMFPIEYINNLERVKLQIDYLASDLRQIIRNNDINKFCNCNQILLINTTSLIEAQLYQYCAKSKPCYIEKKECSNCKYSFYLSFYTNNKKERFFYSNCTTNKFISITNETVIETLLLKSLNSDIIYKHSSFKNYCASYNSLFNHSSKIVRGTCLIIAFYKIKYYL